MKKLIAILGMVMVITVSAVGVITMINNERDHEEAIEIAICDVENETTKDAFLNYVRDNDTYSNMDVAEVNVYTEMWHETEYWICEVFNSEGMLIGEIDVPHDAIIADMQNYI